MISATKKLLLLLAIIVLSVLIVLNLIFAFNLFVSVFLGLVNSLLVGFNLGVSYCERQLKKQKAKSDENLK